jgi:hypothetical protein
MRSFISITLSALLIIGLIPLPVLAGPVNAPLGVILQADRAMVGRGQARSGATVFDGDRIETGLGGQLRVRFGTSQAYLLPKSSAVVRHLEGGFDATLAGGSLVVSAAQGETFTIAANGVVVRPVNSQGTVAQVTRVSPEELLLSSRKGTIEVIFDGEVTRLDEGNSYRMLMDEAAEAQNPQGNVPNRRSRRTVLFILLGAAAAATGVGIWQAVVSPSTP